MNEQAPKRVWDTLRLLGRLVLGGLFIYMGIVKAQHPVDFLKLVRQYEMVHSAFWLNSIAAVLPWFEIFCGALLVLGVAGRGAALVTLAMLAPFTVIVFQRALAIHSAQQIALCAIKFDCGCGGGEVFICRKLVENTLLMALALWLTFRPAEMFCLWKGPRDA